MPTYDYQCGACKHEWELFQSMNDSPVKSCPKCKKRKAKRLLGLGAGLIFKGTGFYETDYKQKSGTEPKKTSELLTRNKRQEKARHQGDKKRIQTKEGKGQSRLILNKKIHDPTSPRSPCSWVRGD